MTAETLALYSGVVVSLLFGYVPGLSTWFENLETIYKRLVMALALLVVAVGVVGLACAGYGNVPVTCDQAGVEGVVRAFIAALIANQATYVITKS